ncbi:hypothetical protein [Endozoicomonas sp. ONNA2]|uniref:hypothetical protein n=1 Tax=Endozoicomonas sp. ONNA2 TaxID=2828741 RepID=UPI0021497355|nr:hypothetical protein [Endozoicomonas sp. ONNA2]
MDSVGQMLLSRDYELKSCWTTLDKANYRDDQMIELYEDYGTSGQHHSELFRNYSTVMFNQF